MIKSTPRIFLRILLIPLIGCGLRSNTQQVNLFPKGVLTRNDNSLICDGKPYMEVLFLRHPEKGTVLGISVYEYATAKERCIYPPQGWKLNGDGCITLAKNDPMTIKQIKDVWKGTVSASYPYVGGCDNVHFSDDNRSLIFTTQTLLMRNPVWEYSFLSGKTRKVGYAPKKT